MHQEVDINYVKRFSMCNCLTIHFPDTYTAHAMTMDVFLKHANPGVRIPLPHADMWPSGYVRVFKIPVKIDTFLFSPFNESYHPNFMFDDFRVTIGPHEEAKVLKKIARPIERLSTREFSYKMNLVNEKVSSMWGKDITKILIIYDNRNLTNEEDLKRVIEYDDLAVKVFDKWPVIRIHDPFQSKPMWCHYSEDALRSTYNKIIEIEKSK